MTANVSAFIQVMEQFLDELTQTFPEQRALKKYKATVDVMRKANPRKVMDVFMESAGQFQDKIMAMDESFFLENDIGFLDALEIKKWWTPELSNTTKSSIWQFLQYLLVTGGATVTPKMPEISQEAQNEIMKLAETLPKPEDGKPFDVDAIPTDAIMNIAKQVDPNSDISVDQINEAMSIVKNMMSQTSGGSQEEIMANMMKQMMGGNM